MSTLPASGLSSRLVPILCGVAALLHPSAPALAGNGDPDIATCNVEARDAALGAPVSAANRRDPRAGASPEQGCPRLEVPDPLPLALLGLGLTTTALTRRRSAVPIARQRAAGPRALPNAP